MVARLTTFGAGGTECRPGHAMETVIGAWVVLPVTPLRARLGMQEDLGATPSTSVHPEAEGKRFAPVSPGERHWLGV